MQELDYKNNKIFSWMSLIAPIIIIIGWYIFSKMGYIHPAIFPSPERALSTFTELVLSGKLLLHTSASLERLIIGFIIALILGAAWGIVVGFSRRAESASTLSLMLLAPIPPFAWFPLAILWFGTGDVSKIFVVVIGAFFPIFLHVVTGIRHIDQKYLEVAKVFEKSKLWTIRHVYLPAVLPSFLVGVRMGALIAWITLSAAEMISGTQGLGYLIINGRQLIKPDVIFTSMIMMGIIGALIDRIIVVSGDQMLSWKNK